MPGRPSAAKREPEGVNPILRQRELGMRLRELRNELGLTVGEVAERLMCSPTKISRLETGARRPNPRDVRDLCGLYQISDQAADELMELAHQARPARGETQYEELGARLFALEKGAVAITSYSMYYVPGLLQTDDYARALIKGIERKMEPDVLEQRVESRLRRQRLLEQATPPRFRALLDEAVLRRLVGGPAVMQSQLDQLLACIRDEKVTIQVIPFEAGAHASTDSNFDFLEFADESPLRPVVFVEGLFSNRYIERPVEIARYREALEYLRDAALSPRDSTSLIIQIGRGHMT